MLLGTTYSHRHAQYLGVHSPQAVRELLSWNFDLVRLGCYWDEVQQTHGSYDFSQLRRLLNACEKKKQAVVLTVGMKAPRWPEFYIPSWISQASFSLIEPHVLEFLEKTIRTIRSYTCIKYIQVENEPLDPSGPQNLQIPLALLSKEVELVRKRLKRKPIVLTLWGE